jgi:lipopolysaccharide/colanic/teichoic acid biosynthesis glycosyltransferase
MAERFVQFPSFAKLWTRERVSLPHHRVEHIKCIRETKGNMRHGPPTSKSRLRLRLAPFDLVWALIAPAIALALRDSGLLVPGDLILGLSPAYIYALITAAAAVLAFLLFRISDGMSRFFSVHDALAATGAVATAVAASSVTLFVFTRLDGVPRSTPVICGLVMLSGLLFARILARIAHSGDWAVDSQFQPSEPRRRILLVGVDRFAAIAIKLIDSQRPRSSEVVAALDPRPTYAGREFRGVKILGGVEDFEDVVDEYAVHGVEISEVWRNENVKELSAADSARLRELCAARGLRCVGLAEALNLTPPIGMVPRAVPRAGGADPNPYFRAKRLLDFVCAAVCLVVFAPLALIVAGLTYYDVGAPVLFWQERVGRNGRKFRLFKFRTLQAPINSLGDRVPEERRLSKIGRAIRATRFDEIPQLINVMLGDMSIVGPRPLLPQDQPPDPRMRLSVRPGITGWAQINGGATITTEDKDALDAWYIQHASFFLDVLVVLRTAIFLATGEKLDFDAAEDAEQGRSSQASAEKAPPTREAA